MARSGSYGYGLMLGLKPKASGMAEVYLRPVSAGRYREKTWDHAAGVAIVEEAGGRVSDLDGRPLDFSTGPRLEGNRGVVASNGWVHDRVLEAIAATEGGRWERPTTD